jgi:hypothetical protein
MPIKKPDRVRKHIIKRVFRHRKNFVILVVFCVALLFVLLAFFAPR